MAETVKSVARGKILRVWNLSARTVGDIESLIQRVRVNLSTGKVITTRRLCLNIVSRLSMVMKPEMSGEEAYDKVQESIEDLEKLSSELEGLIEIEGIDNVRLGVIINRLAELKKGLMEAGIEKKPRGYR